jgi:uncharacterized protein YtpQ (UPF0354 family)
MAHMPREPEAFAEQVVFLLRQIQPDFAIKLVGPSEMLVNGRRLDLDNLYRLVRQDATRGREIVEHYLDQLFSGETLQFTDVSLDLAKPRIMPRIQPESIFEHLGRDLVAHVPYVNGTVIVFVTDLPQMTVSITTEQIVRWGVSAEELDEIARENLDRYAPEMQMQLVESREGGRAVIVAEQDGYDAARLLLHDLFLSLAPKLGGDFYVATPARDMFIAMSLAPDEFVKRLHDRVEHDYERLPYPICPSLFYVTRDGVAGTREAA